MSSGTEPTIEHRVVFDFEVDFSNGGGLQGQDFRLDIDGEDISDAELAAYIVARPAPADGRGGADRQEAGSPSSRTSGPD